MKSYLYILVLSVALSSTKCYKIFPVAARAPFFVLNDNDEASSNFKPIISLTVLTSTDASAEASETSSVQTEAKEISSDSIETVNPAGLSDTIIKVMETITTIPTTTEALTEISKIEGTTEQSEITTEQSESTTGNSEITTEQSESTTENSEITTETTEITTKTETVTSTYTVTKSSEVFTNPSSPPNVTKSSEHTVITSSTTGATTAVPSTEKSAENATATNSTAEATTASSVSLEDFNISINLLPPKTEYRKFDFDPRYDDWSKIPIEIEKLLIPDD